MSQDFARGRPGAEGQVAATHPTTAPGRDASAQEDDQSLTNALQAPWESIAVVSRDGLTYVHPPMLSGVPRAKIMKGDPYFEAAWDDLDIYLDREAREEALKSQLHARLKAFPNDQGLKKEYKRHQDNVSRHRKIREVFGRESPYHPNQLVAKKHMPPEGFCQEALMYNMACKVSSLAILHARGYLASDPWDFYRSRINARATKLLENPWESASNNIRTVIHNIAGDSCSPAIRKFEDPILRRAILLSAKLQGTQNCFRTHSIPNARPGFVPRPQRPTQPRRETAGRRPNSRLRQLASPSPAQRIPLSSRELTPARPQRIRAELYATTYTGINDYRAQKRQREAREAEDRERKS